MQQLVVEGWGPLPGTQGPGDPRWQESQQVLVAQPEHWREEREQ